MMKDSLFRIVEIVRKETLQILRAKRLMRVIIITPILQLLLYGYVATTDVRRISTIVLDLDRSSESRAVAERMSAGGFFQMGAQALREEDVTEALDSGKAILAVIIPHDFSRNIQRGISADVQLLVDGTNSNTATLALNYATAILGGLNVNPMRVRSLRQGSPGAPGMVDARSRIWYNPELRSVFYMVPGVLCILLVQLLVPFSAMNLVKEREAGTIEQLSVTPIRPYELIVGKMIPFLVVGYVSIAVILFTAVFWYEIPIRGSLFELLFYSGIFIVVMLSIGLLISATSKTQEQAMLTSQFFIIPNFLLSGFLFPIHSMPVAFQTLTYLIPLRYYLIIVRSIFLKGTGLVLLWPQVAALVFLGVVTTTLAVKKLGVQQG